MFERVEISCDAVTDRNLMGCEIPRIKLHSKNYTVKLYLLNKSPQLKSLSHNLCHFSGHEQTRSFLLSYSQKWKATSIRKCLPVFFSQLCRPNAIVGFFSRFIRLSAPMFNDIIVLGCIMCLSTIYLFGIRKVNDGNRTMPRICKVRSNVNFMWLSTSQTPNRPLPPRGERGRKGFHNSFCIQHVQRVHGSLFIYSLFCWSIWELLKKPVKWGLSGMNSFLKWTNLREIAFGDLIKIFWLC